MKRYGKVLLGVVFWIVLMLGCVCTARAVDLELPRAEIEKRPTANKRIYDGTEKPLLNSDGVASGGTLQYVVGTNNQTAPTDGWQDQIPQRSETGRYYVWFKAKGDNGYDDSFPDCISSRICFPVTFKVKNGEWDEGGTADKTVDLSRYDNEDLALTLNEGDIPNVGSRPSNGYKAGFWNEDPYAYVEDYCIEGEKNFVYTYVEKPRISATVNFKVVNGSWDDGTTAEKAVTLTGHEGDTLKLTADQIPAVGNKPNETFKAGSWDTVPTTELSFANGSNTTFTYTYSQKQPITATVTFRVLNGNWDDGTTADKTVTLNGLEGDTLKLTASQIPAVGTKPGAGYKSGSWDVIPSPDTAITGNTAYTYRYVKESVTYSAVVTFRVVNGSWDDGTAADKQVTLSGAEGGILYLEPGQIPSAGSRPNAGFKAGSWDAVPSPQSPITRDESFTYTYAAEPAPAPAPEPTPAPSPNIEEPITVPKAPAYVRAKGKKAKVIVTWHKIKKTTKTKALRAMIQGIQVQAATDPDFKNIVKTVNIEKNKTKVKLKLPGQTPYYVRVRYVGADGVSAWSKVKKATAK